jgi:trigger factor
MEAKLPSTVKNLSPVLAELEIEVSPEQIEESYNRALSQLAREAKVRGFRKGKVPKAVLKRMFGKAVLADLREDVVGRHFLEALREHDVDAIGEPEIDAGDIAEGAPYRFSVKVETSPRLAAINYDGIELERHTPRVQPAALDAELGRLRSAMATTADLEEPRPAAIGDMVRIQMTKWADGAWADPPMQPQDLVLEESSAPPQFLEALPGMGVGDEREIEFGQPREDGERNRFLCKVMAVQRRVLPDLDDEFAKDLGEFATLADLRADIEGRMLESQERQEEERLRHALFDALRERNPLELPARILDKQTRLMKEQFAGMLGGDGDGDGDGAMRRLEEGTEKAAREMIHQHFLQAEIVRHGALEVTDADLEAELARMSERTGLPVPKLKAELSKSQRMVEVRNNLMERKVFDFVLPRVRIIDTEPPAAVSDGVEGGKEPAEDA